MAHGGLFPASALCHAFGPCADDIDGEVDERRSHARGRISDGAGGAGDGHCGRVCERRHLPDPLGTVRRPALLDGMGGVSLPLLRPSLRCAARDGKRRGGHQARIPHSAGLVRHVDDDDGDVYLQHQERL